MGLKNKVAIITGASFGIGKATAFAFAREGARLILASRSKEPGEKVAREIRTQRGKAIYVSTDVSKTESVKRMIEIAIDEYGKLDVLFNNAGVRASIINVVDLTEEEFDRTIDVDLKGVFLCCKYAIPHMIKNGGGSIINCSSTSAFVGQRLQGAYNAAKGGVELLTKCMALDFARYNIRVNTVCPSWVRTEMNRKQLASFTQENWDEVNRLHPLGRIGEPQDVAPAVVYLASNESSWVTGTSIMVDGGYTAQ